MHASLGYPLGPVRASLSATPNVRPRCFAPGTRLDGRLRTLTIGGPPSAPNDLSLAGIDPFH
jgi:hypothetical protein